MIQYVNDCGHPIHMNLSEAIELQQKLSTAISKSYSITKKFGRHTEIIEFPVVLDNDTKIRLASSQTFVITGE